jgi:predicted glycoside hydrolase/deacetylase ChbG (UPF0249 family)
VNKSKAVIITADDLGLWPEINDAVMAGYDSGVVSSASLCVTAPASHAATLSLAMRPGLGVGLQLVLCEGRATLPRKHIPNLVDSAGGFVSRPLEAAWLYRSSGPLRAELKAEVRAQIEKFLSSGLFLSHITASFQLHLHPSVVAILKELAEDYPISAIRKPGVGLWRASQRYVEPSWRRSLETFLMARGVKKGTRRSGVFLGPTRVEPLCPLRPATEHDVVERVRAAKRGITEFVCHPGSLSPRFDGVGDAAVVTSPTVRAALGESGVEVISYRDLAEGAVS